MAGVACCVGRIVAVKNHCLQVKIQHFEDFPMPEPRVIISPSLTKGHAMNWLIEKLTELGVDEIRPLVCDRTDVAYGPPICGAGKKSPPSP